MIYCGRVGGGGPCPCIYPTWDPDLSTDHCKPDIETFKVNYGEKLPLRDQSRGIRRLWAGAVGTPHSSTHGYYFNVVGSHIPVSTQPGLSLYGELRIPYLFICPTWPPDLSTNHWKPDIETFKVNYGEKLPLVKDRSRGIRLSGRVLWGPLIPAPMVII